MSARSACLLCLRTEASDFNDFVKSILVREKAGRRAQTEGPSTIRAIGRRTNRIRELKLPTIELLRIDLNSETARIFFSCVPPSASSLPVTSAVCPRGYSAATLTRRLLAFHTFLRGTL